MSAANEELQDQRYFRISSASTFYHGKHWRVRFRDDAQMAQLEVMDGVSCVPQPHQARKGRGAESP
jgi:hypothetical protein